MAFKAFMKVVGDNVGDVAGAAIETNHDGWIDVREFSYGGDRKMGGQNQTLGRSRVRDLQSAKPHRAML